MKQRLLRASLALALVVGFLGLAAADRSAPATAAPAPQLTRYPYLTDVVQTYATVNWATDRSQTKATLKYGLAGSESCSAHSVTATKTAFVVGSTNEYQWKAKLTGLAPNALYCYRVFLGTVDLLGSDQSPQFWTQIPSGDPTPFSFAVFGDWGDTDANGNNPYQSALMSQLASSGVRFAVATGDTAYDSGTQKNYGDLQQTGYRVSSIFGPDYWPKVGGNVPLYTALGNHGVNNTFFSIWPQDRAVAASNGAYAMETYCCENGANSQKHGSAWYAFDYGNARFYILTTAWGENNVGTSDEYGMDYAYRWQHTSPEYQWLKNDLRTHQSQLKFAIFHYPIYADNATEGSDPYLEGPDSLEGLLADNGVDIAFSGHSHMYERNLAPSDGLVTYVNGGGGAKPQPISKCKPYDAYGIGWSSSKNIGSACGAAVKPTQVDQVYHFMKVTVSGTQVTVTPINSLGQTFDVMTYDFSADAIPPSAPSNLQASAPTAGEVDLTWNDAVDANGIAGYDIYRDGGSTPIASVAGTLTAYADSSVDPETHYDYMVKARDPSGNVSDPSNTASVTTPSTDTGPPTAPSGLNASSPTSGEVDLRWTGSTDDEGVTAYDVYRDGNAVATLGGSTTSYTDLLVMPGVSYTYSVRARDAAGHTSDPSGDAGVTPSTTGVLFTDTFESGTLGGWTSVNGLTTANGIAAPSGGAWVARATGTGAGATSAYRGWSPGVSEVFARFRFKVLSRSGSLELMRFRNPTNGSKLTVLVDGATGKLSTRNTAGVTTKSSAVIANGDWHLLEVHAKNGAPSTTEVWLDGVRLTELDATGDVGSTNFGQFLLGSTATGTYDVVFDDVIVSKNDI